MARKRQKRLKTNTNALIPVQEKAEIAVKESNLSQAIAKPAIADTDMSLSAEERAIIEKWRSEKKARIVGSILRPDKKQTELQHLEYNAQAAEEVG